MKFIAGFGLLVDDSCFLKILLWISQHIPWFWAFHIPDFFISLSPRLLLLLSPSLSDHWRGESQTAGPYLSHRRGESTIAAEENHKLSERWNRALVNRSVRASRAPEIRNAEIVAIVNIGGFALSIVRGAQLIASFNDDLQTDLPHFTTCDKIVSFATKMAMLLRFTEGLPFSGDEFLWEKRIIWRGKTEIWRKLNCNLL